MHVKPVIVVDYD